MPVINVKTHGMWHDIASSYNHIHTMKEITDLPASLVDDVEALKDKVGAESVAYQISSVVQASEYVHPFTHPADMITGLSDVAISGDYNDLINLPDASEEYVHPESHPASMIDGLATVATSGDYNDLTNKPTIPSIDGLATVSYVDERIASVGGGSGGGITEQVQSDWDETNVDSPAYIKNKPFGEVNADIALIDGSYKWVYYGDGSWDMEAPIPITSDIHLEEGKTYTVTWNDTEYTCECFMYAGLAGAVGNGAVLGGDNTGEPFIIVEDAAGLLSGTPMFIFIVIENPDPTVTTEVTYDIKLTYSGVVVNHLDNKYLSFMDYVEPNEIDILPLTEYNNFTMDTNYGKFTAYENPIFTLTIGETYTVFWDDEEPVECIAQDASTIMSGAVIIGNASDFPGLSGNNEPFIIAAINGMGIQYFALNDTEEGGSHKIKINQHVDGCHVIKDKYVPKSDWNNMKNKPFGTTPSGTVIFDDMVNCNMEDNGGGIAIIQKLDIGTFTYNVEFDGNSYQIVGGETHDGIILSHDLFAIQNLDNMCLVISALGEHTLKITLAEDIVTKIDSKYIPKIDGLPAVTTDNDGQTLTVANGMWTVTKPSKGVPEVTTSDNGKFLRVVDGIWTAVLLENAEEVAF